MSAEIIHFIRCPKHDREQTDFPTIAFRSALPDDSAIDRVEPVSPQPASMSET